MQTIKITSRSGMLLAFVAFCCTAISSGVYFLTKDKIEQVMIAQQRELLLQVIPQDYFTNDLTQDCYVPKTEALQNVDIQKICMAKKDGDITAYAFESVAHDGYSGDIRILVGMKPDGKVGGEERRWQVRPIHRCDNHPARCGKPSETFSTCYVG